MSKAIIFDLFDTLVHGGTREERDTASHAMADELGVDRAAFAAIFRKTFSERFKGEMGDLTATFRTLAERCGAAPGEAAVARAVQLRVEFTRTLLQPFPGVLDALDVLIADGRRLALVTNCTAEVPELWPATPLASRFTAAVFSSSEGIRKPDAEIYLRAAERLGARPDQCVFVGDGASGELPGAEAAGMWTVRILNEALDQETFGGVGDWTGPVVRSVSELGAVLRSGR